MKQCMAYGLSLCLLSIVASCQKDRSISQSNNGIQYHYISGSENANDALFLRDGGTAYVGNALNQGYLFVTDENGKERWKTYVGGDGLDQFFSVIELSDGGFVALGSTYSFSLGVTNNKPDAWIVKFSPSGKVVWQKTLATKYDEEFSAGIEDSNGDLFLVGLQIPSSMQSMFAKYTADGDLIYTKTLQLGPYNSSFSGVVQAPTGEYVIGGVNSLSNKSVEVNKLVTNMLVVNALGGQVMRSKIFLDEVRDNLSLANKMDVFISGNEVTLASYFQEPVAKGRVQIIRAKMNGTRVFEKKFSGLGNLYFSNLERAEDGGYLLCGSTSEEGAKQTQGSVIKLTPDCEVQWRSSFGTQNISLDVMSVSQTASGFRAIGKSFNNNKTVIQMIACHLNNEGELIYE